ncbi:VanZ family protein [Nocardioides sp. Y6]|uniref:VanZ family protein n=1 Tax=Nocardioides malaquae TaxID=2773426 RepID=A0ABR9RPL9_9ACTN|nr:VanZ family protein [Nocardioides malaquae]MBE7323526.1 VanZ family protein [Nocardioides malaquae]
MLSTILVEHPWLTTTTLVALVVVGPLLGAWLVGRQRTTAVLLALALLVVAALTLVPTSRDLERGCWVEWTVPTPGAVELVANVILFVPVVLLLGVLLQRPLLALLTASAGSLLVETVQALAPALGRSCSTNDWLSNTIGAALGALLAVLALVLHRRLRGVGAAV